MKKIWFLAMIVLPFFTACKKETGMAPDCNALRTTLIADNHADIGTQINKVIQSLDDKSYTAQNLEQLVQKIRACGIDCEQLCFDCIKTLPSQSELRVQINGVSKIIDITYTPNNKMEFRGVH